MRILFVSIFVVAALSKANAFTAVSRSQTLASLAQGGVLADCRATSIRPLRMADEKDEEFWRQQKVLIREMSGATERAIRAEQKQKFAIRRNALVSDTAFIGFFIFCSLWSVFDNPFVAFSYAFGASLGLAYAYGLGKYVESIGVVSFDAPEPGDGVGQARLAFLFILFIIVGKFRAQGLLELPAITGFFTYQLASLSQGLREYND
jgi:hypothetical protein